MCGSLHACSLVREPVMTCVLIAVHVAFSVSNFTTLFVQLYEMPSTSWLGILDQYRYICTDRLFIFYFFVVVLFGSVSLTDQTSMTVHRLQSVWMEGHVSMARIPSPASVLQVPLVTDAKQVSIFSVDWVQTLDICDGCKDFGVKTKN